MLIKNADLSGQRIDVRVTDQVIEIGEALQPGDEVIVEANGGAILPGLHDHHLHLNAAAVAATSVSCAGLVANAPSALEHLLQNVPGTDWIRAVGYHESMAGDLDCVALDRFCARRPVRMQHSSGKLWVLNSAAIERLQLHQAGDPPGLERDASGQPTGRLFRMDTWLRQALTVAAPPDLSLLSRELASYGITSVTDASYSNSVTASQQYAAAQTRGELLQKLYLMGDETLASGPLKIMLDEDDLPDFTALVSCIRRAHEDGRAVAFHCVSHVELLVAMGALKESGGHAQDRIEHAAVVRADVVAQLVGHGCTVVTQPGFIADRGERYRRDADAADLPYLYPYASLLAAGVPVAASSDAPYGPLNPWLVMSAAVSRQTEAGQVLGMQECVSAQEALRGYLSTPQQPGGAARKLEVGAAADLCILGCGLDAALNDLANVQVRHTIAAGQLIYSSAPSISALCSPR